MTPTDALAAMPHRHPHIPRRTLAAGTTICWTRTTNRQGEHHAFPALLFSTHHHLPFSPLPDSFALQPIQWPCGYCARGHAPRVLTFTPILAALLFSVLCALWVWMMVLAYVWHSPPGSNARGSSPHAPVAPQRQPLRGRAGCCGALLWAAAPALSGPAHPPARGRCARPVPRT